MTRTRLNLIGVILFWGFRLVWTSLVVLAPALGVWVASSLAAYRNGPVWLVCLAGLLLFPVLPVLWDTVSERLRRRTARRRDERVLTTWDRIVLRTLLVNLAFLTALLWLRPELAFTALSTRGDWFLAHIDDPRAERARAGLLRAADGLQWIYEAAHRNEYADMVDTSAAEAPAPSESPRPDEGWDDPFAKPPEPMPAPSERPPEDPGAPSEPAAEPPTAGSLWPQPAEVHPAVRSIGDAERQSIETVGRYLLAQEPDQARRIKALHDFTATHLAYDVASYRAGKIPDQSAATVFATRLAVCAGYANLMKALGDVTGDEVVVVIGDARNKASEVDGEGHAWNAAKVDGVWYLFDPTWDSGSTGETFEPAYRTDYLFVPPGLIGVTHFPSDPAWQLREPPLSRGEYARQPMLRPKFFAEGFGLPDEARSQVTVQRDYTLRVTNPRGRFILAKARREGAPEVECEVRGAELLEIRCGDLAPGTYSVELFGSRVRFGTYQYIGELQANVTG